MVVVVLVVVVVLLLVVVVLIYNIFTLQKLEIRTLFISI